MDLDAFVARHQQLLQQERQAEMAETQRLLKDRSDQELEDRGVLLRRLAVADLEPGLGGALHAVLQPSRGGPLPPHRFSPGDVVALDGGERGVEAVTATVARVRRDHITVAIDQDDVDLPPVVRLVRLAPDVTFRRMVETLAALRQERPKEQRRLVEVCFRRREPAFGKTPTADTLQPFDTSLDDSQRRAIAHALAAEEIALIHGPPGTGKTTAVVEVIRQAVHRGQHVLACAPSNVAVDNLAERLVQRGLRIVRIGHPVRVLPAVVAHTLAEQVLASEEQQLLRDVRRELQQVQRKFLRASRQQRHDLRELQRRLRLEQRQLERAIVNGLLDTADVVLATTTGAGDPVLGERMFDLAVVDEAAQALEAATWLPLLRAPRAVLAGDHWQLPPTIVSAAAAQGGLGTTLFERLAAAPLGDLLARMLTTQYRMHRSIQGWSSATFYGGALSPAPAVAGHLLSQLDGVHTTDATSVPLLFLDTAGCGHEESAGVDDESKQNVGEAAVAARAVQALLEACVPARDVAVITPYSAQVRLLREKLGHHQDLEIGTVDGLQGREKEAIVLSLVRSNDRGEVGFLAELRRLNVALTRARRHLCVIGDSGTLAAHPDLGKLVEHLQAHGEHRSAWGMG